MRSTRSEAIYEAARLAEGILYVDICGALQLDLVIGWGESSPRLEYPKPMEKYDSVVDYFNSVKHESIGGNLFINLSPSRNMKKR